MSRLATPADMIALLEARERHMVDLVAPLSGLRYSGGALALSGLDPVVSDDGVTDPNGRFIPTQTAENQLGALLGIPTRYLAKLRHGTPCTQTDVTTGASIQGLDMNVNGWTHRAPADKFVLVRTMVGTDPAAPEYAGYCRAILSNKYGVRDYLDTGLAVLDGMRAAGLGADNFQRCDITDDRMFIRIAAPEVFINAPELLAGYRDPATGRESRAVGDVVFAGVEVTNSETGGGAVNVRAVITVLACTNGMVRNSDAFRAVHLGARMDEGQISWGEDTRTAAMDLTKKQVRDAIRQFMTTDYLHCAIAEMTVVAGGPSTTLLRQSRSLGRNSRIPRTERTTSCRRSSRAGR